MGREDKVRRFSSSAHDETLMRLKNSGEAVTARGFQQVRETGRLHQLVDPQSHQGTRESRNLILSDEAGKLVLTRGMALPFLNVVDTTGSMEHYVAEVFKSLPISQKMLVEGPRPLLGRYHVHVATGVAQDIDDRFPFQISEFEGDNRIAEQQRLLVNEGLGGDAPEDYLMALWYTATRTKLDIIQYGLKGYFFLSADEMGRPYLEPRLVSKVMGDTASLQGTLGAEEVGQMLLGKWHGFFLQVSTHSHTTEYWSRVLGRERVVLLPRTELLAHAQAAIVGLTEGTLDLQEMKDYLKDVGQISSTDANSIVRAVSHIPIRAQAELPNFGRIPLAGALMDSERGIWPIGQEPPAATPSPSLPAPTPSSGMEWEQF